MASNLARYKEELQRLVALGDSMELGLLAGLTVEGLKLTKEQKENLKKHRGTFEKNYQRWFTEASAVVRQLIPDRLKEFDEYYRADPKRKTVNLLTYSIQDWVNGSRANTNAYTGEKAFNDEGVVVTRFHSQREILAAAAARFDSSLLDIRQVVQADLFDSELEMARELLKKGFVRPAGVLAGVVVERHLAEVCRSHGISPKKRDPTIGDFNDALKANETVDVPVWRSIQRLGDLRNLAAHNKSREPTEPEMDELIAGAEKLTKSLF